MILAALAGMTPNAWHRPIAYFLMITFVPIAIFLGATYGSWAVVGYLTVAVFQLRLLLISWAKKAFKRTKR